MLRSLYFFFLFFAFFFIFNSLSFSQNTQISDQAASDLNVILTTEQAQSAEFATKISSTYQIEDCSDVIRSAIDTKAEQSKTRLVKFFSTARLYKFTNEDFPRVKNYFIWMLTYLDTERKNAPTGGKEVYCTISMDDLWKLGRELDAIKAAIDAHDLEELKNTSFRLDNANQIEAKIAEMKNQPVNGSSIPSNNTKFDNALNTYYTNSLASNSLPYWKVQEKSNREELYSNAMKYLDEVVAANDKQYMTENKDKIYNALDFVSGKFFDGAQNDWLSFIKDAFKDEAIINNKKALTDSLKFLANVSAGNESYPADYLTEKMIFASGYLASAALNKASNSGNHAVYPDQYDYGQIRSVIDALNLNGIITDNDYRDRLNQLNQAYSAYQEMIDEGNTKKLEDLIKTAKAHSNNSSNGNPLESIKSGLQKTNSFLKGLNKILSGG